MEKVLAVVLKTVDYRDSDKMVTLLSRDFGRIDALARGCKKQTSPLLAACQPFVVGEFYLSSSKNRNYISHCNIIKSFFDLSEKLDSYAFAAFITDIANRVSVDGPSERLFSLCVNALFNATGDVKKLTAYFLVKLSDILGFRPQTDVCAECGGEASYYFSPNAGGVLCEQCFEKLSDARKITTSTVQAINRILLTPPIKMAEVEISDSDSGHILNLFFKYLENILESSTKSLRFLKQFIK